MRSKVKIMQLPSFSSPILSPVFQDSHLRRIMIPLAHGYENYSRNVHEGYGDAEMRVST